MYTLNEKSFALQKDTVALLWVMIIAVILLQDILQKSFVEYTDGSCILKAHLHRISFNFY